MPGEVRMPWVVPVVGVLGCPEAVLPDCPEAAEFPFWRGSKSAGKVEQPLEWV